MGKDDIVFSRDMIECLNILDKAVQKMEDPKEKEKADFAIKYLLETASKGIEPMSLYSVARGCPNIRRLVKTGTEIV
ncbi:MAG: hypothetical protein KAS97_13300 [Candidatus Aminicenantes bacterium]|nr:hypothetical protein [Candidatus Aminicenantes bacterium]